MFACTEGTAATVRLPPAGNAPVAPDFALKATDGRNFRLSEYRGGTVVLTFWASWCGPCRESLATLDRIGTGAGVALLGVNVEGLAERAVPLATALNLSFPTLLDAHQAVARAYAVDKLPLTLLIDRDGKVRGSWSGAPADPNDLALRVEALNRE